MKAVGLSHPVHNSAMRHARGGASFLAFIRKLDYRKLNYGN